jgi:hypothetical protein
MSVEQSAEWELAEETKVLEKNLPQSDFVLHKSHMTGLGSNQGAAVESQWLNVCDINFEFHKIMIFWLTEQQSASQEVS